MRVLVTGGAGYIGSVVSAQLLAVGHEVIVVDDLSTGHADAVPPGAQFHQLPITALDGRLGEWHVDAAIHFAAKSLVGESTEEPALYWRNNVVGTIALLDSLRAYGVQKIVFSSSAATYGQVEEQPIREDAPTRPTSPYGASKLAVDMLLTDYANSYGMAAVSLRYFNVAGALHSAEGLSFGERHATETHLIPNALRSLARGDQFSLYGTDYPTPDGTCVRDYIHVVDLGEAHLLALGVAEPGVHQIVNLGSGRGYSNREVLLTVAEVTDRDLPIVEAPRRPGDPPTLVASNEKAGELLGWTPTRDLHAMVLDAWNFEQDASSLA
jgi:UDP-glucose 4-epimerase